MTEKIISNEVHLAAKRAFVRTTAQAYSTSLAGGVSTTAILAYFENPISWIPLVITWVVAILSPILAGGASYLSIIGQGVPEAYQVSPEAQSENREYTPKH